MATSGSGSHLRVFLRALSKMGKNAQPERVMEAGRLTRTALGTGQGGILAESGFSLLELMIVVAVILIMASFAAPIYSRIVTRSHEAVLKDDLFTMRSLIDRYTLDNQRPPESLDDLVRAGYLKGGLPVDPFTGSNQTWQQVEPSLVVQRLCGF
jgi:prepilin-type N-terminal cleavage/methylation domain-containing protein